MVTDVKYIDTFLHTLIEWYKDIDANISEDKIDNRLTEDILQAIGAKFINNIDMEELKSTYIGNKRNIQRMASQSYIGGEPIVILLVYMVIFYPHRLTTNENIDEDMIKMVFHYLGESYDSYY